MAARCNAQNERIRSVSLLLGHVRLVVVRVAIDKLVQRINSSTIGHLVHDDFKCLPAVMNPLLLEIERLLLGERFLPTNLGAASTQISIEFVFQELVHLVIAVPVPHRHQRGIFGQRFRYHV